MSENKIPIPSMIYNAAVGGHVTNSQQIIDENLNREQNDINQETVGAVPYNSTTPNGMGRIVLKKNDNFKQVVEAQTDGNTIFIIKYDFTLTGNVTIPANCVLQFEGGSISGAYIITGNNTVIKAELVKLFSINVSFAGSWNVGTGYPEWFGTVVNDTSSICVSLSINKLYTITPNVLLPKEGIYYSTSGESILVKGSLRGVRTGRSYNGVVGTYIQFRNIVNGQSCVIAGISNGDTSSRMKALYVENITLSVNSQNVLKTSALEVGAVSTIHLTNVYCLNLNYRTSDLTETELQNPAEYCNYGILLNGDSEFVDIQECTFEGSIAMYCKRTVDFFEAYTLCCITGNNYGFAAIYGNLGSAVSFQNVSLNQGHYGIYLTSVPYPFVIKDFRIEQLVSGGTDFYFSGNRSVYPGKIILKDGILNQTCNLITLKGSGSTNAYSNAYLIFDNVTCISGSESGMGLHIIDCSEATKWEIYFNNCNIPAFSDILLPAGYIVEGLQRQQTNALPYIIKNASIHGFASLQNIRNSHYRRISKKAYSTRSIDLMSYIPATTTSTSSASAIQHYFKMTEANNNIIAYICDIKVYGDNIFGRIRLLTKYTVSSGTIQDSITRTILSKEGDDVFSLSHEEGKITYGTASTGNGLSIFNHLQDNLLMEIETTLIEKTY